MEVASSDASPEKTIHNEHHASSGHADASKDASSSPAKGQQGRPAARLDSHMSRHTYHGHRRASFITKDIDELTELRARQRTFEGAYQRTALGMAVYACIILKIFSKPFAKIGIIYVVMAALLILISIARRRQSMHDFADQYQKGPDYRPGGKRYWGREFKTVGNLVIFLCCAIGGLELAVLVVLMRM
ncbi:hypothetical protein P389DRAFT_85436 [Cystobasidium minutum MCA 4210]|uniref:uncharacterized protein n=1 Tax=Cystobasidium minutum MCA 4210 TaxID=1397322 RepID=UPI0034CD8FA9|eukprot:jgi/Rhomi1/85436/CE85435_871